MGRKVEADVVINDKSDAGINSVEKKLGRLSDNAKKSGAKSGDNFGKGLVSAVEAVSPKLAAQLSGALEAAGSAAAPVLAASLAAAAPLVGAALSGAVIGGVGLGGVAGGLLVASKDARVQAAAEAVGSRIENRLKTAGVAFVQPAIDGLGRLEKAVDHVDLDGAFRDAARFVEPLADGIGRAVESLGDGLTTVIANADGPVREIAEGIAGIGDAAGDGLRLLADNGEEGADALRLLLNAVNESVRGFFALVNVLTETYGFLDKIGLVSSPLTELFFKMTGASSKFDDQNAETAAGLAGMGGAFQDATDPAEDYRAALDELQAATDRLASAQASLFGDLTSVGEAEDKLTESVSKNGKTLDAHTEKGRANRDALERLGKSYGSYVSDLEASGASTDEVAAKTDEFRGKLVEAGARLGLTKQEARNYANALLGIPNKRTTTVEFRDAEAKADLARLKAAMNDLPKYQRITVEIAQTVTGNANSSAVAAALRKNGAFAGDQSFAFAQPATSSRLGGPSPVSVSSSIENRILLDGRPFRSYTDRVVAENSRRESFRAKVGNR